MATMIGFKVTPAFRAALRAYAAEHDITMTDLVRRVLAAEIGYELDQDDRGEQLTLPHAS